MTRQRLFIRSQFDVNLGVATLEAKRMRPANLAVCCPVLIIAGISIVSSGIRE